MKVLKWLPFLSYVFLFAQQTEVVTDSVVSSDSLVYQIAQNSFSLNDDADLLGYSLISRSSLTNFGAPIVPWRWNFNESTELRVGDAILEFGLPAPLVYKFYPHKFPHTKIVYSQTYSEGQRLSFLHKNRHKYGSFEFEYDQLVSQGFMLHEKNKYSKFNFQLDFYSPKHPYKSALRFHSFKNTSQWNAGLSEDSLFQSESSFNWELLPVNWQNLSSSLKHKGLDWKHTYSPSDVAHFEYEINIAQDSLFYEGLQDDTLLYPGRLDSTVFSRAYTNITNRLNWLCKLSSDKMLVLGVKHQAFSSYEMKTHKLWAFTSLKSTDFNNEFYIEYGKEPRNTHTFKTSYKQGFTLGKFGNNLKFTYLRALPSLMFYQDTLSQEHELTSSSIDQSPITSKFIEWSTTLSKNLKIFSSYHTIDGYTYINEFALPAVSVENVQVFQSRLFHHFSKYKIHLTGNAVFQNSSSTLVPISKFLLHQKIYWQGQLFQKATESQLGFRALFRSSHPGMSYNPVFGGFSPNPIHQTEQSLRLDVFANFKIKTIKFHVSYEHFNALFQGVQYVLNPYPMARPILRLSLIWNFYD
jgi:hypothetical protein